MVYDTPTQPRLSGNESDVNVAIGSDPVRSLQTQMCRSLNFQATGSDSAEGPATFDYRLP